MKEKSYPKLKLFFYLIFTTVLNWLYYEVHFTVGELTMYTKAQSSTALWNF